MEAIQSIQFNTIRSNSTQLNRARTGSLTKYNMHVQTGFIRPEPYRKPLGKFYDDLDRAFNSDTHEEFVDEINCAINTIKDDDYFRKLITFKNHDQAAEIYSLSTFIVARYLEYDFDCDIPKYIGWLLYASATYIGILPIMTYSSLVIYNWELVDDFAGYDRSNIDVKSCVNYRGGKRYDQEKSLYSDLITFELNCGKSVGDIERVYSEIKKNGMSNVEVVKSSLVSLKSSVDTAIQLFNDVEFKKTHDTEYDKFIFDGIKYVKLPPYSFSLLQSSLLQALMIFFNIKCDDNKTRQYMPKRHREYLENLELTHDQMPFLCGYVLSTRNLELRESYSDCLASVGDLMTKMKLNYKKPVVGIWCSNTGNKDDTIGTVKVEDVIKSEDEYDIYDIYCDIPHTCTNLTVAGFTIFLMMGLMALSANNIDIEQLFYNFADRLLENIEYDGYC